jgi:hypothetical protein
MLQLVILEWLSGDSQAALTRWRQEVALQNEGDPFSWYLLVRLCVAAGSQREAATSAIRFGSVASEFAQRRMHGWSGDGGLESTPQAWLSLRQLHGLVQLWDEVHLLFPDASEERWKEDLGPWLQRSRAELGRIETWLDDTESGWERGHPKYSRSAIRTGVPGTRDPSRDAGAILRLAFSRRSEAEATLEWAGRCHPRPSTRHLAHVAGLASRVLAGLGP